jgi:hypothetical protein
VCQAGEWECVRGTLQAVRSLLWWEYREYLRGEGLHRGGQNQIQTGIEAYGA